MTHQFIATRTEALHRLARFLPDAGRAYAARRNYDLGAGQHVHVSCLSPYLRCRLLTEEEVVVSVLKRHSAQAAEKFIQEVFWRTYWKGWLEMRPAVWDSYLAEVQRDWDQVQTQAGLRARWEMACRGETGIECFDVWAQELVSTGYLHNHARMWFASIWIFTLELPWALGADFFLRHLLDGDPASNTLGWRWVAGIQTPGKTYQARTSNIAKFTEGRFHPKWQLAGATAAIEAPPAPAPLALPEIRTLVPTKRSGFVLHEDDLSPEYALTDVHPVATAVLAPQAIPGPLIAAPQVAAFRAQAQADVATRWQDRFGPVTQVGSMQELCDWADRERLEQIVTPYAPVGPVAQVLNALARTESAPPVISVRREWDQQAWPRATKGFFAFKKQIPAFLNNLGVYN